MTVVVATFNHARFLRDAVASSLDQTAGRPEIIIVDDGSVDDPAAVLRDLAEVRLLRQENAGPSAARNTGWRAARGEYVVFLDADDRLLPNALEVNLGQFSEAPDCAFVYGAYRLIDEDGRLLKPGRFETVGLDPYECLLSGNCIGMLGTVMFRRDRLAEVGGFDPGLRAGEDYDLFLRLAKDHPVRASPSAVADYRKHGENHSRDIARMLQGTLTVIDRQLTHAAREEPWRRALARGRGNIKSLYVREALLQLRDQRRVASLVQIGRMLKMTPGSMIAGTLRVLLRDVKARLRAPPPGRVAFGHLRRLSPLSTGFGYDRGTPLDRRYIERFLGRHAGDVRGRVLEIGDDTYTRRYGGRRVTQADVLNRKAGVPGTTFVGDLADGAGLPDASFDCVILTQTLHLIFDMRAAVATLFRSLKPGGVLLVTVPGVSSVDAGEWKETWYWAMTDAALRRLLTEFFPDPDVLVGVHGNVLAAVAALHGFAEHELDDEELDHLDARYPVIVTGRAVKPGSRTGDPAGP